ncbi:hypothetical protein D3C81_1825340 [compost metagenome]
MIRDLHINHELSQCLHLQIKPQAAICRIQLSLAASSGLDMHCCGLFSIRADKWQKHRNLCKRRGSICIQQKLLSGQLMDQLPRGLLQRGGQVICCDDFEQQAL